MKKFLIELNMALAITGICVIDPERSSLTAIILLFCYFSGSFLLFIVASRKGWLKNLQQ